MTQPEMSVPEVPVIAQQAALQRYRNDAAFHQFVDQLRAAMDCGLQPKWIREAVDFAIETWLLEQLGRTPAAVDIINNAKAPKGEE